MYIEHTVHAANSCYIYCHNFNDLTFINDPVFIS